MLEVSGALYEDGSNLSAPVLTGLRLPLLSAAVLSRYQKTRQLHKNKTYLMAVHNTVVVIFRRDKYERHRSWFGSAG